MSDSRYQVTVDVRFRDCDPLGHVNNAVYLTYFEVARFGYWREVLGHTDLTHQPTFILARVECDFRAPATVGDVLDVKLRAGHIGRSSFAFEGQIVQRRDGTVVAEAKTVQVMYDYGQGRSVPMPDDVRAKIEAYEAGR